MTERAKRKSGTAYFGDREVPEAEKSPLVRGVFSSVASRYDLMNDLMSGGVHRLWKAEMIAWLRPAPGMALLDVAGGTGDIAFRALDKAGGEAQVAVCDITESMLRVGRDRAIDQGRVGERNGGIAWICGDAEALPFADRSFDAYSIAFGLRNVTRPEAALAEAQRVLKPGGRFLCLEFSRVVLPVLSELYDLYSTRVLPALGQAVARDRESYKYLVDSIRRFPPQDELLAMLETAGLEQASYRNLTGGIAALHSAWRI